MPTPICNFGDVIVVPFPFTDRPIAKRRPALVLSTTDFNRTNQHTICAMITTGAHSSWAGDIPINDLDGTGLNHASLVRWKLMTIPNELLLRVAGRLQPATLELVAQTAANVFGLPQQFRKQ